MTSPLISRRSVLQSLACGFGSLALADMLHANNPLAARQPHHAPKAKRSIFIVLQGGPDLVDAVDDQRGLGGAAGPMMPFDDAHIFARERSVPKHGVMKYLWRLRQYGQSGKCVSVLLPHCAKRVYDICCL